MNKRSNKFDYPHPLIKNLHAEKIITSQNFNEIFKQKPTFYDSNYLFSPSIKNAISPKLLRLSNSKVIPEEKFGLLMQPFHARQQVELIYKNGLELQHFKCQHCKAFFSNQCQSISLYQLKCRICDRVQSITPEVKNQLQNIPRCYDLCDHEANISNFTEKNICFVIQASEFNYNYRVHEVVRSCLKSLESTLEVSEIERKYSQVQTQDEEASTKSNPIILDQGELQRTHYKISFILFNDKNIFLINQCTNDVLSFNESFLSEQQIPDTHNVISFNDFFKPISEITEETFSLIQEILYDSYLNNTSCLHITTKFIYKYIDRFMLSNHQNDRNQNLTQDNRKVEYKFFVNSLKFTKKMYFDQGKQEKTISENLLFSNRKKSDPQQNENNLLSQLTLSPNFEFFYLPQSQANSVYVSQKEIIQKLNNNLYRLYPQIDSKNRKNGNEFFNRLYYDLFENLSTEKHFDIKVSITTSENLQVLSVGNKALGYNDCITQFKRIHSSTQRQPKYNRYQIVLKVFEPKNTLPIDLKIVKTSNFKNIKHSISETMHFMQISFEHTKPFVTCEDESFNKTFTRVFHIEIASLDRAINVRERIYSSLSTYVDDQVLFYFYLRWILIECHNTKTNHTIFKKLFEQMEKISDQFKDSYGQIDFHKEYVRIFLYSFMIMNKALVNGINENFYLERHQFIKNSMQSFSKSLYPRTYQIIKNKETKEIDIKNVKSSPKKFTADSLALLDNGKNLFIIIGEDNPVQQIKQIFGTCFIREIQQMTELPQLESNIRYRQLIDVVRSQHESNFLPLKIFQLFSPQFDSEISHLLYQKDNHQKFMRKLWDMESAHHKNMS